MDFGWGEERIFSRYMKCVYFVHAKVAYNMKTWLFECAKITTIYLEGYFNFSIYHFNAKDTY